MFKKRTFSETLSLLCARNPEWMKPDGNIHVTRAAKELKLHQPTLKRMLDGVVHQPSVENGQVLTKYFRVTHGQLLGVSPISGIDSVDGSSEKNELVAEVEELTEHQARLTRIYIESIKKAGI